jgi:hypothetical protein
MKGPAGSDGEAIELQQCECYIERLRTDKGRICVASASSSRTAIQ